MRSPSQVIKEEIAALKRLSLHGRIPEGTEPKPVLALGRCGWCKQKTRLGDNGRLVYHYSWGMTCSQSGYFPEIRYVECMCGQAIDVRYDSKIISAHITPNKARCVLSGHVASQIDYKTNTILTFRQP